MSKKQSTILLAQCLSRLADNDNYLFLTSDFRVLFPHLSVQALNMLLSRAVAKKIIIRVCKGLFLYPLGGYNAGYVLYHAVSKLRGPTLNYLSLESVLSEAGIISQIPLNWLTVMTRGRSGIINCGEWGSIEFIHTKKGIGSLSDHLVFDHRYCLWRASPDLAIRDMKAAKRSLDLIDWSVVDESV